MSYEKDNRGNSGLVKWFNYECDHEVAFIRENPVFVSRKIYNGREYKWDSIDKKFFKRCNISKNACVL